MTPDAGRGALVGALRLAVVAAPDNAGVRLDPEEEFCQHSLGVVLHHLGRDRAAEAASRRAFSLDPRDADTLSDLAETLAARAPHPAHPDDRRGVLEHAVAIAYTAPRMTHVLELSLLLLLPR